MPNTHKKRKLGKAIKTSIFVKKLDIENYADYIEINSDIRFGKPCVKGTRITVYDVLGWLSEGMTPAQIK